MMDLSPSQPLKRLKLLKYVNSLIEPEFEALLFALKPNYGTIPPISSAQGNRSTVLLTWVESPTGCGMETFISVLDEIAPLPSEIVSPTPPKKNIEVQNDSSRMSESSLSSAFTSKHREWVGKRITSREKIVYRREEDQGIWKELNGEGRVDKNDFLEEVNISGIVQIAQNGHKPIILTRNKAIWSDDDGFFAEGSFTSDFISTLAFSYQYVLGREPNSKEKSEWMRHDERASLGMDRLIFYLKQYLKRSDEIDDVIIRSYKAILFRDPSSKELEDWRPAIREGGQIYTDLVRAHQDWKNKGNN